MIFLSILVTLIGRQTKTNSGSRNGANSKRRRNSAEPVLSFLRLLLLITTPFIIYIAKQKTSSQTPQNQSTQRQQLTHTRSDQIHSDPPPHLSLQIFYLFFFLSPLYLYLYLCIGKFLYVTCFQSDSIFEIRVGMVSILGFQSQRRRFIKFRYNCGVRSG